MHSQDHLQSPRAILPKWCEPTEKARAVQIVRKLIKLLMLVCPLVYCRCNRCALWAAQNKLNTFTVFGAKNRWRRISLGKSNLNLKSHPSKDKFPKPEKHPEWQLLPVRLWSWILCGDGGTLTRSNKKASSCYKGWHGVRIQTPATIKSHFYREAILHKKKSPM